jgi:glycosyltransferase involved in cell wall biosynthesis
MKFVSLSYHYTPDIDNPEAWFNRIRIYTGSWELIARENQVIRLEQINLSGKLKHGGIEYHFLRYGKRKLYFPWRLHRYLVSLNPDIVIVNGLHFPLQTLLLRWQLPKHVKIIAQNHGEKAFEGVKKYWQRRADTAIDAYLFASRAMGERWVRKGNIASIKKIHEVMEVSSYFHPIDKQLARTYTRAVGSPIYLWVGRLEDNKDPLTVVKAFTRFLEFHPEARLYMIYQTNELLPTLMKLIPAENKRQLILVGKVSHEDLIYWYNSADFILSGSHHEGSGTAICEAMSCGCIPILTQIDSFSAMTNNAECGLLYEAGNQEALVSCLVQSVDIDKTCERKKTLQQFQQALSFEAIAQNIQRIAVEL